jgi:hypothetical protein
VQVWAWYVRGGRTTGPLRPFLVVATLTRANGLMMRREDKTTTTGHHLGQVIGRCMQDGDDAFTLEQLARLCHEAIMQTWTLLPDGDRSSFQRHQTEPKETQTLCTLRTSQKPLKSLADKPSGNSGIVEASTSDDDLSKRSESCGHAPSSPRSP